ncbi:MAG TPA: DUF2304 domain-containing protein [Candidatus Bipolaricaulota bacterium]|nr:DUF2304 domain-containing protein [Candidatus Bipolaricaulota bacterium]
MNLIQIFILLFVAYVIYRLTKKLTKRELSAEVFVLWLIFWLLMALVVILPQTSQFVADWLGVGRGVDVMIYISIIVLFYIAFRIFARLEKMEKDITLLVKDSAIREAMKNKIGRAENNFKQD